MTDHPPALTIPDLQDIFGFSNADLLANRAGRFSTGQHRLITPAIGLLVIAAVVIFTIPFQGEAGRVLGIFGGLCFGTVDLVGLLAGVAGLGALWNTARESKLTPLACFIGYVGLQANKDETFALVSDAFTIPIEAEAAEKFIEGDYKVYYVPKFVNDRDNLFSIEPAIENEASPALYDKSETILEESQSQESQSAV